MFLYFIILYNDVLLIKDIICELFTYSALIYDLFMIKIYAWFYFIFVIHICKLYDRQIRWYTCAFFIEVITCEISDQL